MSIESLAIRQTTEIIFKACNRHAKEQKLDLGKVQLVLGLDLVEVRDDDGELEGYAPSVNYTICENYTPVKKMTFKQVLGAPDFFNKEGIAVPVIAQNLVRYAQEYELEANEIKAVCLSYLGKNSKGKEEEAIKIYLYKNTEFLKQTTVKEFINLGQEVGD